MTFACGLSFTHWRLVHEAHHREPQHEELDPDVQFAAVLSVHRRAALARRGVVRALQRGQAWYFWPLALVYAWSLRWDSIVRLFTDPVRTRVDRWALLGHYGLWLLGPALLVGAGPALAAYAAVSAIIGVYLVAIFAPNHLGLPSIGADEHPTYLRQQLGSARDIAGGRWLGVVMGGLEHQIEHHLFPSICQPRLARARRITAAFCTEHGLRRRESGFLAAHRDVLVHLARLAALAASPPAVTVSHHPTESPP